MKRLHEASVQVAHAPLGQALQRHGEHEELVKQQAEHVEMLKLQLAAAVEKLHLLEAASPARGVC